jgi:5-(carboxyamino)imidazole ribonucleotide mutase
MLLMSRCYYGLGSALRSTIKERFSLDAKIGVIMGSSSDWETMKHTCDILDELQVPYEKKVVSAHRTPDLMFEYAETARTRGIQVIVAGAGGAAHLPGMVAAKTTLPVIGVPIQSKALNGLDSLLSIVQMPGGVPVATVAIGKAGATNAGLLAAQMLAMTDTAIADQLDQRREATKEKVFESNGDLI